MYIKCDLLLKFSLLVKIVVFIKCIAPDMLPISKVRFNTTKNHEKRKYCIIR